VIEPTAAFEAQYTDCSSEAAIRAEIDESVTIEPPSARSAPNARHRK
jgi:hypothetical protein